MFYKNSQYSRSYRGPIKSTFFDFLMLHENCGFSHGASYGVLVFSNRRLPPEIFDSFCENFKITRDFNENYTV